KAGHPRVACEAAVLVAEAIEPHQSLWRDDLAEDESSPHGAAIRELHAVVEESAGLEFVPRNLDATAWSAPPVLQVLGLGECIPHVFARRVEGSAEDEFRCFVYRIG